MFYIQSAIEIAVFAFIIFGLFNEDKLVKFEDKIKVKLKAKRRTKNG